MPLQETPIKRKIMAAILLTSFVVLLLTVTAFTLYDLVTFRQALAGNLVTLARVTADNSTAALTFQNEEDAANILDALKADPHITAAALYDSAGNLYARYPANVPTAMLPATPTWIGYRFERKHLLLFEWVVHEDTPVGTLFIKSDLRPVYERLQLYTGLAVLILLGSLLVALGLSNALQRRISEPIFALAETARAVSTHQDFSVRAPRLSGDELGLLTDAFNQMLTRIQEQTAALRESEEGLRLALEASRTSAWERDLQTNHVTWSGNAHQLFGVGPSELELNFQMLMERIHPADRQPTLAAITSAIEHGHEFMTEFRVIWPDNSVHYLATRGKTFYDASGKPVRIRGVTLDITPRRQAEAARAYLAAIVESSDDAIIGKDLNGTVVSWNRGAERIYGYTADEIVGASVERLLASGDPQEEQRILDHVQKGETRQYETLRHHKDGRQIIVSLTVSPVRDVNGAIIGVSSISRDITERRHAEEALRESRARLEGIIESAMDAIISVDASQRVTMFNRAAEQMFGCPAKDALGQPLDRFIPPRFRELHRKHVQEFGMTGVTSRAMGDLRPISGLRVSGEEFPIEASISQIEVAGQKIYTVILRDISQRVEAEEALQRQARVLREQAQMLDLANVMARDLDDRVILWNSGMEKMYGWSRTEMLGRPSHELLRTHYPLPLAEIKAELLRKSHWEGELVHTRKDGRSVVVSSQWVLHKDDQGRPVAVLEVNTDITERKQAEEQVLRMNVELEHRVIERTAELTAANKELEAFTYSVAHDLRAPLRHIDAFTKILHDDFGPTLPAESRRYLENIRKGSQNMSRLVDDLLNLARVGRQELKRQPTPLNAVVDEVLLDLRRETEGRDIEWRIGQLPVVACDPGLIKQVFANLLSNAVKYTRPRSESIIEVGQTETAEGDAIFVRDNGVGFNMKYADKLFGVFQRLHRTEEFEGTGVGLATVERIIRKHGGRIWAEAELDQGARFFFTLDDMDKSAKRG